MVLALSDRLLRNAPVAPRRDDDPLQLNLPPLLSGPDMITPQALRGLAAMYLQAELEQAGLIFVVELLADAADHLALVSATAARKLEDFRQRRRDWYDHPRRESLFARVFGFGATQDDINHDFQSTFANFCAACVRYANELSWTRTSTVTGEVRLRQSAIAVALNLTPRQYGNTLLAGRLIGEQLNASIDVLSDPGIASHFGARDMWDTLRKILGPQTPDLGRLITRGQSGMRLLNWLAGVATKLVESQPATPLTSLNDPVFAWAAQWLAATGLSQTVNASASGGRVY
jgi:hypothetical protein